MFRNDDLPASVDTRAPRPLTHPGTPSLLAELESYWHRLRGARALPVRTEVDAAAIDAILPHAFVAERVAPQVLRLRFAGQRLAALLGMEPRGMPLCAFFTAAGRAALGPLTAQALDGPAIIEAPVQSARGVLGPLVPRLTGRMILLPLADVHGVPNRMIGAILCDGAPGRGTVRFDMGQGPVRIEPVQPAPPLRDPDNRPRLRAVAGGRAANPHAPVARAGLRLVVSNG